MARLDLVVRNARLATESGERRCDIGVADGRAAALGEGLPQGAREIDAGGRLVLPGGVDAHCHLDQPMPAPMRPATWSGPCDVILSGKSTRRLPDIVSRSTVAE